MSSGSLLRRKQTESDTGWEEKVSKWCIIGLVTAAGDWVQLHWKLSENPRRICLNIHLLGPPLVRVCSRDVNSPVLLGYSSQRMKELLWLQKNPGGRIAESYRGTRYGTLAVNVGTVQLHLKSEVN